MIAFTGLRTTPDRLEECRAVTLGFRKMQEEVGAKDKQLEKLGVDILERINVTNEIQRRYCVDLARACSIDDLITVNQEATRDQIEQSIDGTPGPGMSAEQRAKYDKEVEEWKTADEDGRAEMVENYATSALKYPLLICEHRGVGASQFRLDGKVMLKKPPLDELVERLSTANKKARELRDLGSEAPRE